MSKVFSRDFLDNCRISECDWLRPLTDLDKNVTYLIGSFNHGNVVTMVSYKDGVFYFADKVSIQRADYYRFSNLQRAYAYFEQMFYGRGDM